MSAKRKTILVGALLLVIFSIWFLVVPTIKYSAARKKYPVGMSLGNAQGLAKPPCEILHPAYPVSPEWKAGEMPESAKHTVVVVALYCPSECITLGFNSYSNLIEVQPLNDPIDTMLWLRSRR
jgi:hypothetical protein